MTLRVKRVYMREPGCRGGRRERPALHCTMAQSPFLIAPATHEEPLMGTLFAMMRNVRHYLHTATRELTVDALDAVPGELRNSIGALLAHIAAAERMIANITVHERRFSAEEADFEAAFRFERNPLAGADVSTYHEHLATVRARTLELLQAKDDAWLLAPKTFFGQPSNTLYYLFHMIQDEARHTGQIILLRKHLLPGADPEFEPYSAS